MKNAIYHTLTLENQTTNFVKLKSYVGYGRTLGECKKDIIKQIENDCLDFEYYDNACTLEFIKINKLNSMQVRAIKLLIRNFKNEEDCEVEDFDLNYIDVCEYFNQLKMVFKNLKLLSIDEHFDICVDTIAPGYYHNFVTKRS